MSAFQDYTVEVAGIGTCTVIDPAGEPGYRVRLPDGAPYFGQVTGCAAQSGEASPENAAADIAAELASPRTPPPSQAQIYAAQLAAGYTDEATGIKLKTTEQAQSKFTQGLVLIARALDAGQLTDESTFSIWDFDNVEHVLTVADYRALILRYGLFCQQLFNVYAP